MSEYIYTNLKTIDIDENDIIMAYQLQVLFLCTESDALFTSCTSVYVDYYYDIHVQRNINSCDRLT